jgi:hypothetical protein
MSHPPRSFYFSPVFWDLLEKELLAFSKVLLLVAAPVLAIVGLGLSWLLGWFRPHLNVLTLAVLGVLAVLWLVMIRNAGRKLFLRIREKQEFDPICADIAEKASNLNRQFLARHIKGGEPFVLFLRSFDIEFRTGFGATPGRPRFGSMMTVTRPLETGLARALEGRIPVYSAANLGSGGIDHGIGLPKITIPNESWRKVLVRLINRAEFIVVDASDLTPGLVDELQMLDACGREGCTVVITPTGKHLKEIAWRDKELALIGTGNFVRTRVDTERANRILARFHRVVPADKINFSKLESMPAFAGLLPKRPRGSVGAGLESLGSRTLRISKLADCL